MTPARLGRAAWLSAVWLSAGLVAHAHMLACLAHPTAEPASKKNELAA